ncbi:MAG TPA: AI-2E family transporter, partial [Candidatus Angelobacter sp.]|nr:AI-2E family transporter [Candidatus Angelobacter sp.]
MATNRIIPPAPEQLNPEEAPDNHLAEKELQERQERKLNAVLHAGAIAQIVIGAVVVLAVCYVAKLVLITLMVSILITFMLEPLVRLMERVRLPRSLGSIVAILLLLGVIYGASYFFYNRAVSFAHELPKYSDKIRGLLSHVRQQTSDIEKTAEQVIPPEKNGKKPIPVTVQSSP